MEGSRAWQPILQLPSGLDQSRPVLDVAWAPNVGRRYHYVASAEGEELKVYKLLRDGGSAGSEPTTGDDTVTPRTLSLEAVQTIHANAWRCQWNVTGTVLASSGDAGMVHLWKANGDGQFECVSSVQSAVKPE